MVEIKEYVGHKPIDIKESTVKKNTKNSVKKYSKKEEKENGIQKENKK